MFKIRFDSKYLFKRISIFLQEDKCEKPVGGNGLHASY